MLCNASGLYEGGLYRGKVRSMIKKNDSKSAKQVM